MSYVTVPKQRPNSSALLELQMSVINEHRNNNATVRDLCNKYNLHFATVHSWLKKRDLIEYQYSIRKNIVSLAETVSDMGSAPVSSSEVVLSSPDKMISNNKPSFYKQREVAAVNDTNDTPPTVKFCPCCGMNIEAVALALEVATTL